MGEWMSEGLRKGRHGRERRKEAGRSSSECCVFMLAQELLCLISPSSGNLQKHALRATEQTGYVRPSPLLIKHLVHATMFSLLLSFFQNMLFLFVCLLMFSPL